MKLRLTLLFSLAFTQKLLDDRNFTSLCWFCKTGPKKNEKRLSLLMCPEITSIHVHLNEFAAYTRGPWKNKVLGLRLINKQSNRLPPSGSCLWRNTEKPWTIQYRNTCSGIPASLSRIHWHKNDCTPLFPSFTSCNLAGRNSGFCFENRRRDLVATCINVDKRAVSRRKSAARFYEDSVSSRRPIGFKSVSYFACHKAREHFHVTRCLGNLGYKYKFRDIMQEALCHLLLYE